MINFPITTVRAKAQNAGEATRRRHAINVDGRGWSVRQLAVHLGLTPQVVAARVRVLVKAGRSITMAALAESSP